jgi:Uma2 family endonuclease
LVRAVLVNAESLLEQRRRLDIDRQDERWDGEWHFVNPSKRWHPRVNSDMYVVLTPLARSRGLVPYCEATGIFADLETDWRVPDQVYARPDQEIDEGLTGAELVVEVRSPGDESYAKLAFYAARGITEAMIVHRDRRFELFRLCPDGLYQPVEDGRCTTLGVTFTTVEGPKLRIDWDGGAAEV